jgi:hypothetical protein
VVFHLFGQIPGEQGTGKAHKIQGTSGEDFVTPKIILFPHFPYLINQIFLPKWLNPLFNFITIFAAVVYFFRIYLEPSN